MQDAAFSAYMEERSLADKTRQQRGYALKRIEKFHNVDLDDEFNRDGLHSLASQFTYSAADARAGRANPTRLDIDADKLLTHLRWYKAHIQDYRRFRSGEFELDEGATADIETERQLEEDLVEQIVGKTFALERDLQTALRANLSQLEPGLVAIDGGGEARVEAGFIDILARDSAGKLTVIELKSETAKPEAVAQLLAYMGCVSEQYGEAVRGILVAGDHHPRVKLAARAVTNMSLKKYRYRFDFE
jgi:endonuclease